MSQILLKMGPFIKEKPSPILLATSLIFITKVITQQILKTIKEKSEICWQQSNMKLTFLAPRGPEISGFLC